MNKKTLIKICGIKTPELAFEAANLGANFIGIVFHARSKRFVHPQAAKKICEAAEKGSAQVVGVFIDHNVSEILNICDLTGIKMAQLHGATSKKEAFKLPQNLKRIYVVNVGYDGKILDSDDKENIGHLDSKRDFLLFDGIDAGSGKPFSFNQFSCIYNVPFFLAGGLNINNVEKAVSVIHPDGVDVSSGVENNAGEKEPDLIKEFIARVKHKEESL